MVAAEARPRIQQYLKHSTTLTLHCVRWIPHSARVVALGSYARGTGCLQVLELDGSSLAVRLDQELPAAFKCGCIGASVSGNRQLATGNFIGELLLHDLEASAAVTGRVQAHVGLVNSLDCCGGQGADAGPPEVVTGGADGCVRVWDARQLTAPVSAFAPASGAQVRECWSVAFGDAHSTEERCVLAGYDNGDLKLFDLRMGLLRWETALGNGVCGVQFDRRGIAQNKFAAACLESQYHVFDARTLHPDQGYARTSGVAAKGSTLWGCFHTPQNRELFMLTAGDGSLHLCKYVYPDKRVVEAKDKRPCGVAGSVEHLAKAELSSQPICTFDWSPDRLGLFACAALDQSVYVGLTSNLQTA